MSQHVHGAPHHVRIDATTTTTKSAESTQRCKWIRTISARICVSRISLNQNFDLGFLQPNGRDMRPTVVFEAGRLVLFPPPPHGLGSASVF